MRPDQQHGARAFDDPHRFDHERDELKEALAAGQLDVETLARENMQLKARLAAVEQLKNACEFAVEDMVCGQIQWAGACRIKQALAALSPTDPPAGGTK